MLLLNDFLIISRQNYSTYKILWLECIHYDFFKDINKLLLQQEICQLIFIDIFDLYWQGQM